MINCHPNLDDSVFNNSINKAIKEAELTGYISMKLLKILYNLFSWVYIEGDVSGAFNKEDNSLLVQFLNRFDLGKYKGSSLSYSAVLFYQKLSKTIDIRKLEDNKIEVAKQGVNKLFYSDTFTFKELYDIYKEGPEDLSEDFIHFNNIFKEDIIYKSSPLVNIGDICKVTNVSSLVRPDLIYNIITNKLNIRYSEESKIKNKKTLYILQDCTYSMQHYLNKLKLLKAFILNTCFKYDYEVEWIYCGEDEYGRQKYTKENILKEELKFIFIGMKVNFTPCLVSDEMTDKNVIIITDGTDSFDFPFNTKTSKINVISFTENINIKNKIANYGRVFRAGR